ncbi:hypothetical protein GGI14_005880, partial [Coemansia sp. S680]
MDPDSNDNNAIACSATILGGPFVGEHRPHQPQASTVIVEGFWSAQPVPRSRQALCTNSHVWEAEGVTKGEAGGDEHSPSDLQAGVPR